MYCFHTRIRYSESDSEGKLTMAALLNYFQDCSTFHSEDLGLGVEHLKEQHLVWVLSSWQIVVERYPRLCEKVEVGTLAYDFKGFVGLRNFFMKTEQGEYLAKANSVWSLLDTRTGKPTGVSEEMQKGYQMEERLQMEYAPRKIALPKNGEKRESFLVKKHHLDTNYHVNNGQFVMMALEYVPEGLKINQLRAEYKKQAFLGDVLYPYVAETDQGYTVALQDINGVSYANVEVKIEKHIRKDGVIK